MDKHWLARLKRRLTRYRHGIRLGMLTVAVAALFFLLYATLKPMLMAARKFLRGPATAFSLVKDPQDVLRSTKGRTNLVLLGMGGENHEGALLTDTIILISVDLASRDAITLSIPRDIWIASLQTKVNAVYYYGEQKQKGGGIILAKAAVEEIVGQPVHYAVVINFDGFRRAIDLVGGIDVVVPESFDDFKYPIPGMEQAEPEELRYEHLHFDAGAQRLSGERALKYVRSRNAAGPQGTDFARAKRQQQVVEAFRDRILSLETLLSPTKIKDLAQTFSDSVTTDLTEIEYLSLAKLALFTDKDNLRSAILSQENGEIGEPGLLTNPPASAYGGQWVLVGKDNSWDEVHRYVEELLFSPPHPSPT